MCVDRTVVPDYHWSITVNNRTQPPTSFFCIDSGTMCGKGGELTPSRVISFEVISGFVAAKKRYFFNHAPLQRCKTFTKELVIQPSIESTPLPGTPPHSVLIDDSIIQNVLAEKKCSSILYIKYDPLDLFFAVVRIVILFELTPKHGFAH